MTFAYPNMPKGGIPITMTDGENNNRRLSLMERADANNRIHIARYANLADEHVLQLQMPHPNMPELKQEYPSVSDTIANIYFDVSSHGDPAHSAPVLPFNVEIVKAGWVLKIGKRPSHIAGGKTMFMRDVLKYQVNGKKAFYFAPYQGIAIVGSPQSEGQYINYRGHELISSKYRLLLPSELRKRIGMR